MLAFSVEVGQSFQVQDNLIVEPQAQIKLADVNWDGFNDGWNDVLLEDHTYITWRLGRAQRVYFCAARRRRSSLFLCGSVVVAGVHEFTGCAPCY